MPFVKGNKLAKKAKGVSKTNHIQAYLDSLSGGCAREYYTNLEALFSGVDLDKPVKEAMDRFERNTEFILAKKARIEHVDKDGANLPQPIINVSVNNGN